MDFFAPDWAGWLFFIVIFLLPLSFPRLVSDGRSLCIIWLLIILHEIVAIQNAFISTTLGADADAWTFQRKAATAALAENIFSHLGFGANAYATFLTLLYSLFGASLFLGEQFSILAFFFSCIAFIKIADQLKISRDISLLLLLFGALPSMVLFGSVTLREPWQILFFIWSVYFGLQFQISGRYREIILCSVMAFLLGATHDGLMPFVPFLILVLFLWKVQDGTRLPWFLLSKRRIVACTALLLLLSIFFLGFGSVTKVAGMKAIFALMEGGGLEFVEKYREGGVLSGGRTTYGILLDTSSPLSIAVTALPAFSYYMFAPFPWQVSNLLDVYAACESLLRLALVVMAFRRWRCAKGVERAFYGILLSLYFAMSFLWSLGTVNYGTSMRHHIVNYWILVILGGPGLIHLLSSRIRKPAPAV